MGRQNAPYVVRWRNGVMDDTNPALTWRALVAAMALTRYADVKTGHNCYPGAKTCARAMRVSVDTIHRGWAELEEAGWLKVHPLPSSRRASQGALKELRWPPRNMTADSGYPLTAANIPADSGPTFPGNQEPSGPSGPRVGEEPGTSQAGEPGEAGGCAWDGCGRAATVDNFGASWCEAHAAEMYQQTRRPSA